MTSLPSSNTKWNIEKAGSFSVLYSFTTKLTICLSKTSEDGGFNAIDLSENFRSKSETFYFMKKQIYRRPYYREGPTSYSKLKLR